MTTPDFMGEPRLPRLSKLLGEFRTGQIRIPRFQRPFVWDDEQRLQLLESIYRGFPIGSLLIWRTESIRLVTYDVLGPIPLPEEPTDPAHTSVRQYLIDGHQRMTTLYASLGPGLMTKEERDGLPKGGREDEPIWPIYCDLEAVGEDGAESPFHLPPKGQREPPRTWLRMDILLDSYALGDFKDELRKAGHRPSFVNRVQHVADIFRDYQIPVVPIATEDLTQATTSFKRVNSGGTQMSELHMVNALTWSHSFDFLELIEEGAEVLARVGWQDFPPQMLLNVAKSLCGLDIYRASAEQVAAAFKNDDDLPAKVFEAVMGAAHALREASGIRGPRALPYVYQGVIVASVMAGRPAFGPRELEILDDWLWATTLTEYFRGMTGSLFGRARDDLAESLDAGTPAKRPGAESTVQAYSRAFDYRGARCRGIALLLAGRDPDDGHELLARYGNDALVRLVKPRELPSGERWRAGRAENRFLTTPGGGAQLRQALVEERDDTRALADRHLVSEPGIASLRSGDFVGFLRERAEWLLRLERERAESVGLEWK